MAAYSVTLNADETITVKVGRYIETIGTQDKGSVELLDAVRWALITGGVTPDEADLWMTIRGLRDSS